MSEYGWNDPPSFSYNSLQSTATKRTQLTKRVNHELSASSQTSTFLSTIDTTHTLSGPPTSATNDLPPPPPPSDAGNSPGGTFNIISEQVESSNNAPSSLETNFDTVIESLGNIVDNHSKSMQSRTGDDIKRRLQLLASQWRSGKLSSHVQKEMTKLTSALESEDYTTADAIHVSLMVDHISEVSQWMVGIKRLIATLKQQK